MFTVSPSIYSADLLELRKVLQEAEGFEHIHLDIDDGNFVRGISFGTTLAEQIAAATKIPLDAHLEVLNPLEHVDALAKAGVETISAHLEVLDYPTLFLSRIHNLGRKAGIALNLKTPVSFLEPYAGQFDLLLLVSVEADEEGLPFRRGVLKKIRETRELFGSGLPVWVDGGINDGNLKEVVEAGADGVVIGRAVFRAENFRAAYEHFLQTGRAYEREARKH